MRKYTCLVVGFLLFQLQAQAAQFGCGFSGGGTVNNPLYTTPPGSSVPEVDSSYQSNGFNFTLSTYSYDKEIWLSIRVRKLSSNEEIFGYGWHGQEDVLRSQKLGTFHVYGGSGAITESGDIAFNCSFSD